MVRRHGVEERAGPEGVEAGLGDVFEGGGEPTGDEGRDAGLRIGVAGGPGDQARELQGVRQAPGRALRGAGDIGAGLIFDLAVDDEPVAAEDVVEDGGVDRGAEAIGDVAAPGGALVLAAVVHAQPCGPVALVAPGLLQAVAEIEGGRLAAALAIRREAAAEIAAPTAGADAAGAQRAVGARGADDAVGAAQVGVLFDTGRALGRGAADAAAVAAAVGGAGGLGVLGDPRLAAVVAVGGARADVAVGEAVALAVDLVRVGAVGAGEAAART